MSQPKDESAKGTDFSFLDSLTTAEEDRLERLMEAILWMAWPRRPGFLDVPLELRGVTADGQAVRLSPEENVWRLEVQGETPTTLSEPREVVRLMAEKGFLPSSIVVVPEIAPHVYLAAIIETEHAQLRWEAALCAVLTAVPNAQRFFKDKAKFDAVIMKSSPWEFVSATDSMDACVRHSVVAIPLAVSAADAQVNTWANVLGGWTDEENRKGLSLRYQMLAARQGVKLSFHEEPLSSLRDRIKLRNDLIHGNAIAEEQPLEQRGAGRPLVLDARRTCLAVRQALLVLAQIVGDDPPSYLAYCPEATVEDDEAWANARLLTGMREDSIFPKVADKHAARAEEPSETDN